MFAIENLLQFSLRLAAVVGEWGEPAGVTRECDAAVAADGAAGNPHALHRWSRRGA